MIRRLGTTVLIGAVLVSGTADAAMTRQNFTVISDPGVELAVREVSDNNLQPGRPPVVLLHGARVPGVASFDLPVEGGSLAADLVRVGHRVFIMDARGYGGSSRDRQDGNEDGQPLVRSDAVVRDIAAVVDVVQARTGASQVALLGWATGGHWVGMYASQKPDEVSHLVIYNSLYGARSGHKTLGPGSDIADPNNPGLFHVEQFGAYRLSTAASLLPSWDRSIPLEDKAAWRDPKVAQAYQAAAVASDPTSASRNPPSFRAPSGAMADSFELASGRKLWDAGSISAHVLVIRSGYDFWSRPEDVTTLAQDLRQAASVRTVTIPQATHFVHLDRPERGRTRFLAEVSRTLARPANVRAVR
ncbi:alpha/beta hydrolase [Sinorhizobium meliloti]|uniref:Alpha/beta hydrolase n=2 Tax=Rhizobium meliloti TaxID=382 RepID=A0A2J0YYA1_RHIML|nr:alpha/beta hydrolase [Sinorhizobium meliloti]